MKPINVDFFVGKFLRDYGLKNSDLYPLKLAEFDGNILKLETYEELGGELVINLSDSFFEEKLKIKVKNAKGEASSGGSKLINNEYVDISAGGPTPSVVVISVPLNGRFEMSGFSIVPR
ncbi:hypothetical protein SGGMMB4_00226 [Sodalis glossinidius str. 'morsitans']|uniref:Uncharacterized protein n=1 Tax=Sodalis glossinidius (strain morsitans) TaxID=343509 RepID=A0A193QEY5_SODGM|nr:hypothetical protein [Sodalis glossinidius]CRL43713.1 hypothetical protein SGGMMB4_00226 [Sodalis glossinidius str. 'morsitans']